MHFPSSLNTSEKWTKFQENLFFLFPPNFDALREWLLSTLGILLYFTSIHLVCCNFKRNRFLLTVICFPIYHWLEVSHEVNISQAQSVGDIFTEDWPTTSDILGNKSLVSKILLWFEHIRNVSFSCFHFSTITWKEIPPKTLTVIEAFTCVSYDFDVRKRYTIWRYGNENWCHQVTKLIKMTSRCLM